MDSDLQRIVVLGTSGSGKSTLARELARRLSLPRIELDALFWLADWTAEQPEVFRSKVANAIQSERWVVDGNYGVVRDLVWPGATTIIWLDYSFPRVFWQALTRTLRRTLRGEELWAGNRESLRRSFLSRESILLWVITSYRRRRKEIRSLVDSNAYANIRFHVFRRPDETAAFVDRLG